MKVLFISSGRSGNIGTVVKNQGESLKREGLAVDYFIITPGIIGYITSIPKIRKLYKSGNYDLAHAHYGLSAFATTFAGCIPLVVSLMGSDIYMSGLLRLATRYFCRKRWNITIVKTQQMKELLNMERAFVIPNGVDTERFRPISKIEAREKIGYPVGKRLIVFISSPNRPEKNIELAWKAIKSLKNKNIELLHVYDIPNEKIPFYLNAADALLLTSRWEGSANVVKEAMACNCPIVSTNVGDVKWVLGQTEGCYITKSDFTDIVEKINFALNFNNRTQGRNRLSEIELDSKTIASKIIALYNTLNLHV